MNTKIDYKKTKLGDIADWKRIKLNNIFFINTKSVDPQKLNETVIHFSLPAYDNGKVPILENSKSIKSNKTLIKENSILVSKLNPRIPRVWKVKSDDFTGIKISSTEFMNYVPKKDVNIDYFYFVFSSEYFQQKLLKIESGTTGSRKRVIPSDTLKITLLLPPLKEQQKIAEILSIVDEQIEQTDQLIEKTKELKKGLMQQLLTKGIGHTEFKQSELGDIPVEWEIATLGSIVDISSGLSPSKIQTLSKEGEYPFFKVNDLNFCVKYLDNAIYNFEDSISLQIKKDSIIFPKRGASIFTNKIAIVNKSGLMDTNLMALYVKDKKKVNFEFIYYYLLNRGLSEIADTSSVPQINNKHIEPLKISLPKFEEQQKITNILSSVDEELEGYEEEKAQYEELKKGLMQQLLTGKTRVKID